MTSENICPFCNNTKGVFYTPTNPDAPIACKGCIASENHFISDHLVVSAYTPHTILIRNTRTNKSIEVKPNVPLQIIESLKPNKTMQDNVFQRLAYRLVYANLQSVYK